MSVERTSEAVANAYIDGLRKRYDRAVAGHARSLALGASWSDDVVQDVWIGLLNRVRKRLLVRFGEGCILPVTAGIDPTSFVNDLEDVGVNLTFILTNVRYIAYKYHEAAGKVVPLNAPGGDDGDPLELDSTSTLITPSLESTIDANELARRLDFVERNPEEFDMSEKDNIILALWRRGDEPREIAGIYCLTSGLKEQITEQQVANTKARLRRNPKLRAWLLPLVESDGVKTVALKGRGRLS